MVKRFEALPDEVFKLFVGLEVLGVVEEGGIGGGDVGGEGLGGGEAVDETKAADKLLDVSGRGEVAWVKVFSGWVNAKKAERTYLGSMIGASKGFADLRVRVPLLSGLENWVVHEVLIRLEWWEKTYRRSTMCMAKVFIGNM